jgi:RNA polymerase sigma-70 factor, ECF subfamily
MAVIGQVDVSLEELEQHRRELTGYCYRMLGSGFEAEDAAQETIVRAWKAADRFEGRSAVRSWLYRIATNVCLDALRADKRRARPMEMGPRRVPDDFKGDLLPEGSWVSPIADSSVVPEDGDPAELAAQRETIRLAFVAALQHLPAKQRAVLILREVLRWQATEVAELLDTTVASVNSALQRARSTLSSLDVDAAATRSSVSPEHEELLARYVDAFERYDISALVGLLHDDVVMSMPPYDFWLQGTDSVSEWLLGTGSGCRGSRLVPVRANGVQAFGQYRVDPAGGWSPWGLVLLEIEASTERIVGFHTFLEMDSGLFASFGLPEHLPAA